jgi:hypothetical protein
MREAGPNFYRRRGVQFHFATSATTIVGVCRPLKGFDFFVICTHPSPALHVLVSHEKNHHRQECLCHRSVHRRRGLLRSTCLLVMRKTITGKSAGATGVFIAGEGFSAHSSQKRA